MNNGDRTRCLADRTFPRDSNIFTRPQHSKRVEDREFPKECT